MSEAQYRSRYKILVHSVAAAEIYADTQAKDAIKPAISSPPRLVVLGQETSRNHGVKVSEISQVAHRLNNLSLLLDPSYLQDSDSNQVSLDCQQNFPDRV